MFTKRHATALPRVKPARIVGSIAGEPYNMVWVVSSLRKDKKTGVLDPVPQDPYAELLFSSCFKNGGKTMNALNRQQRRASERERKKTRERQSFHRGEVRLLSYKDGRTLALRAVKEVLGLGQYV